MNFRRTIKPGTVAVEGKNYPIYNGDIQIGSAVFLKKDGDFFEFDIQLLKDEPKTYNYNVDVDRESYELIAMRVEEAFNKP